MALLTPSDTIQTAISLGSLPCLQVKTNLITLMGNVHGCMRQGCQEYFERYRRNVFVTPKSFLSFISGYKVMYETKLAHTRGLASSIAAGLQKMNDAKTDVNRMKVRAAPNHPTW